MTLIALCIVLAFFIVLAFAIGVLVFVVLQLRRELEQALERELWWIDAERALDERVLERTGGLPS